MQSENIHLAALTGYNFNLEEKILIQASLNSLKEDYKLDGQVEIWGKILGVQRDYIVARGHKQNYLDTVMFFRYISRL